MEQTTDEHESVQNLFREGPLRNPVPLTTNVAQDAAGVSRSFFKALRMRLNCLAWA